MYSNKSRKSTFVHQYCQLNNIGIKLLSQKLIMENA
jgi:hypothetical protein